jgi:hypothetical protein
MCLSVCVIAMSSFVCVYLCVAVAYVLEFVYLHAVMWCVRAVAGNEGNEGNEGPKHLGWR